MAYIHTGKKEKKKKKKWIFFYSNDQEVEVGLKGRSIEMKSDTRPDPLLSLLNSRRLSRI